MSFFPAGLLNTFKKFFSRRETFKFLHKNFKLFQDIRFLIFFCIRIKHNDSPRFYYRNSYVMVVTVPQCGVFLQQSRSLVPLPLFLFSRAKIRHVSRDGTLRANSVSVKYTIKLHLVIDILEN